MFHVKGEVTMPNLVGIEPRSRAFKPSNKLPKHDRLHGFNGHCGCKCASCWFEWKTTKHGTTDKVTVGLCICETCPCPVDGRKLLTPFMLNGQTSAVA